MSEHRSVVARTVWSSCTRRRWLIPMIGALSAGGLILGGLGVPVSAGDVIGGGHLAASADVQGNCLNAAVTTDGMDGSAHQQGDGTASEVGAAAQGTATAEVSACRDDPGGALPEDPAGSVPGELDDLVPDDPDPPLETELEALVAAVLDGDLPAGIDLGLPGGNGGVAGKPAIGTSTSGTASGSVAVGTGGEERGTPTEPVAGADLEHGAPFSAGAAIPPGGTLPRTGGGFGPGVLRLIAFLGFGRALVRLVKRNRWLFAFRAFLVRTD